MTPLTRSYLLIASVFIAPFLLMGCSCVEYPDDASPSPADVTPTPTADETPGPDSTPLPDSSPTPVASPTPGVPTVLQSTFDQDEEGWTTFDANAVNWRATDGSPDGHISIVATSSYRNYWVAPRAYLGNLGFAYGQALSFDRRVSQPNSSSSDDILLISSTGVSLSFRFSRDSQATWTRFTVPLDESQGWVKTGSTTPPTRNEMQAVLADLSQLRIYTDATSSGVTCDLDNVQLTLSGASVEVPLPDGTISSFDQDREGWTTFEANAANWRASGGVAGGFVSLASSSSYRNYWVAPARFLGNQASAYGKRLTFERRVSITGASSSDDVVLISSTGVSLSYRFSFTPSTDWTRFTVMLDEARGWTKTGTSTPPTTAEMKAVLADLAQLRLYSGAVGNGIDCDLENVAIESVGTGIVPPVGITSTFGTDLEDWTTYEVASASWRAAGGDPDGYLSMSANSSYRNYWVAPAKFLGAHGSAYGKKLVFERRVSLTGSTSSDDVILISSTGLRLSYRFPFTASTDWTRFTVLLDERAGWYRTESATPATGDELRSVLADLSQLRIYTGAVASGSVCDLENVVLESQGGALETPVGITSAFNSDQGGWTTLNSGAASWRTEADGNGYATTTTSSSYKSYWAAPNNYQNNQGAVYGGTLTFWRRCGVTGDSNSDDVVLVGANDLSLSYHFSFGSSSAWTRFTVALDETKGWVKTGSTTPPTGEEFRSVLGSLAQLQLYTDAITSGDSCDLDNVVMSAP